MNYGFGALPVWVAILLSVIDRSPSMAQSSTASPITRAIGEICTNLRTPIFRIYSKVFTPSAYAYEVTADKQLRIFRPDGLLIATIQNFSSRDYDNYETCLTKLGDELKSCRDPSHGVERYGREFDVTEASEEFRRDAQRACATNELGSYLKWFGHGCSTRGDGSIDGRRGWCDELVGSLRTKYPQGQVDRVNGSGSVDVTKNVCPPLYCPQFRFRCTVHVRTDPIYFKKNIGACP
jgi:hypothetical protein